MLDFGREIPVVVTLAVAVQHGGIVPGRVGVVLAEVLIRDRSALAVQGEIPQVAVRNVVPVGVRPSAARRRDGRIDRICRFSDLGPQLCGVAAQRHLERRLAIAIEVVRRADPRIEVLPVGDIADRIETALAEPRIDCWRPGPVPIRVFRVAGALRGHVAIEVVPPKSKIERQLVRDLPLILPVNAEIGLPLRLNQIRVGILRDRERRAVEEDVGRVAVHVVVGFRVELFGLEPGLEVVRPGDVGHRRALRVAVAAIRVTEVGAGRAITLADADVKDACDVVGDAGVVIHVPLRDRRARTGFEEQLARQRG